MRPPHPYATTSNGWRKFGQVGGPQGMLKSIDQTLALSLIYYPAGHEQEPHWHDRAQLTFQLAGRLNESIDNREYDSLGSAIGYKPAGSIHVDRWGSGGALLLTASMTEERTSELLKSAAIGWSPNGELQATTRLIQLLTQAPVSDHIDILFDLFALACPGRTVSSEQEPPIWLKRVREAIADDPAEAKIDDIADISGLHRVHLSRQFRKFFGTSPSVFRRNQMAARLVGQLAGTDAPIIHCAHNAGYFDQSHAARSLRTEIGLNLSQTRDLFRD